MSRVHQGPARSAAKERYWRKHVGNQARSVLTARAYCQANGLSEPSFYAWRRELAERDREAKASAPRFAELVLTGVPAAASTSGLQIHLADARIEVFPGCDRATLDLALAALRGAAC